MPAVMLLLPLAKGPVTGPLLALASTLAGNLLLVGSIANLIVADALRGALVVAPNSNVRLLTQSVGGVRFGFTDAIDVAPDGTIWFSDASQRWGAATHGLMDFWEARPTGRLLRYEPASGQTTVALDSLDFANGVAVGPAGAYVLVNETNDFPHSPPLAHRAPDRDAGDLRRRVARRAG